MANEAPATTFGIVGLGLIGGSVGLALREPGRKILGCDPNPEHERIARERFCVDETRPLEEVCRADMVFVCVPPGALRAVLDEVGRHAGPETVITDVTSVKASAIEWASETKTARFVPGHPMAGHEKGGPTLASAWLFRGAKWILTPVKSTDKRAVRAVEEAVRLMGAVPVRVAPEVHDQAVALTSHLPHALAGALVRMAEGRDVEAAGGSWRDMTRVGGAEPELWAQIFTENAAALRAEIARFRAELSDLETLLEHNDRSAVRDWIARAAHVKSTLAPDEAAPTRVVARGRSQTAQSGRKGAGR